MPKNVSVYLRKGIFYVHALHKTQAGFWISDDNVITLNDSQSLELNNAVQSALARSRQGVPTPPPSVNLTPPLLAAAGVASWNTFAKTAKCVGVFQDGEIIEVTPYRNLGGKDGFEPMQDKSGSLSSGDVGLATAVVRALEMAE